ncbi:hypothetical protein V9J75_002047 [Vibrio fluvialis]
MNYFIYLVAILISMIVYLVFSLGFITGHYLLVADGYDITLADVGSLLAGSATVGLLFLGTIYRNDWREPKLFEKKTEAFKIVLNCIESRSIALGCFGGNTMLTERFSENGNLNENLYKDYVNNQLEIFERNIRELENVYRHICLIVSLPKSNELTKFIKNCKSICEFFERHISNIDSDYERMKKDINTPEKAWEIFNKYKTNQNEEVTNELISFINDLK